MAAKKCSPGGQDSLEPLGLLLDAEKLRRIQSGEVTVDEARRAIASARLVLHQLSVGLTKDRDAVSALLLAASFHDRSDELAASNGGADRTRDYVREWFLMWMGAAGGSDAENDAARREKLVDWCRIVADKVAEGDPTYGVDRATDNVLNNCQSFLPPVQLELARSARNQIRSLIEAMNNRGGRRKLASKTTEQAMEELFTAMRWQAKADSARRRKSRQAARTRS